MDRLLLAALLLAVVPTLHAQDTVIVIDPNAPDSTTQEQLPPELIAEVIRLYNDSTTIRVSGNFNLPAGSRLAGTLAVYRGFVTIEGELDGPITVINGDLVIRPGGMVRGSILVAGGRLTVEAGGVYEGEARAYLDAAPIERLSNGTLKEQVRRKSLGQLARAETSFQTGRIRTSLLLATGGTYNRVEGLPIVFGPAFDWKATPTLSTRLEVRGILRTSGGDSPFADHLGYLARLDVRRQGSPTVGLNAEVYNEIAGIEDQTLPRDEIGYAAFVIQHDDRDYFKRYGWGVSGYVYPWQRLRLELGYQWENQQTVLANDPFSIFQESNRWRPNPLIDDGTYNILGVRAELLTYNPRDIPLSGWWIRGLYQHVWSNDVAPATLPDAVRPPIPTSGYAYDRVTLDVRRYNRLTPDLGLNFRLWAGGWVGGDPLPIQRRLSLGGLDMTPGYDFRSFTCNPGYPDPADPALCDRLIVLQAEFTGRVRLDLGFHLHDQEREGLERFIGVHSLDLVFFGDVGKPWLTGDGPGEVPNNKIPNLDEWKPDLGVGVAFGGFGAYIAQALTDSQPLRFFLRFHRRF